MSGASILRRSGAAPVLLFLLACGYLAVYVPTFWNLFHGIWRTDAQSHGPIVLVVCAWLFWHKGREALRDPTVTLMPGSRWSLAVLATGSALYIVGRSQGLYILEVGSLVPISAALILLIFGKQVLARLWFVFFFMLFLVPLPGSIVDAVTQPLKLAVSVAAEHVLYAAGYPISRSGVVLVVGPYQLLVADACAGLNSLFTLEALGLLYLNVVRHSSAVRNIALALLIVPISFSANVVRVLILSLVTFHFGDAAGQGFLHEFSGMVLFLTALALIVFVDGALRTGMRIRSGAAGAGE